MQSIGSLLELNMFQSLRHSKDNLCVRVLIEIPADRVSSVTNACLLRVSCIASEVVTHWIHCPGSYGGNSIIREYCDLKFKTAKPNTSEL